VSKCSSGRRRQLTRSPRSCRSSRGGRRRRRKSRDSTYGSPSRRMNTVGKKSRRYSPIARQVDIGATTLWNMQYSPSSAISKPSYNVRPSPIKKVRRKAEQRYEIKCDILPRHRELNKKYPTYILDKKTGMKHDEGKMLVWKIPDRVKEGGKQDVNVPPRFICIHNIRRTHCDKCVPAMGVYCGHLTRRNGKVRRAQCRICNANAEDTAASDALLTLGGGEEEQDF